MTDGNVPQIAGEDENGFPLPVFPEGLGWREADGKMWYGDEYCIAGTVAVENVIQRDDATFAVSLTVRRQDNHRIEVIPHKVMEAETFESSKELNVWFHKHCSMLTDFRPKSASTVAFKHFIFGQPRIKDRVRDVSLMGYHADLDCFFGVHGMVDHSGVGTWQEPYTTVYGKGGLAHVKRASREQRGAPILDVGSPPASPREAWASASRKFLEAWQENLGTHLGALAFGWHHAALWRHVLTKREHNFPHLYITGRYQSGKDTMAATLSMAFGVPETGCTSAGRTTTEKWVRNQLGEIGNWPLWLNELRNTDEFAPLCTQIRTSYDLQGSAVLHRDRSMGEISYPNRRSMLLVGEDVLGGDAERSRYMLLTVRPPAKRGLITAVHDHARNVAAALPWMLQQRTVGEEMLACYDHWLPVFMETGCDQRRARAFALAMCGLSHTYSTEPHKQTYPLEVIPPELVRYARQVASQNMDASLTANALEKFSVLLELAQHMGDLADSEDRPLEYSRRVIIGGQRTEIWLWSTGLIEALSRRNNRVPATGLINNELEALPGFVERRRCSWGDFGQRVCHVFVDNPGLPKWMANAKTVTLKPNGQRDMSLSSPDEDDGPQVF